MRTFTIKLLGVIRYLRPDRNPLRRPIDRLHVRLTLVLGAVLLLVAPLAAAVTAGLAGGAGLRAERVQAQTRHKAIAVVIGDPGSSRNAFDETTRIRWQDPAGRVHTATVPVVGNETTGSHRSIWINSAGNLTTRPRTHAQTVADSVMAALTSLTLVVLLHAAVRTIVDRRLDRRRLDLWEREWASVAPRWTGRP